MLSNRQVVDLDVPRDGHYHQGWHLTDLDGNDLSLVGHTLSAVAQLAAGTGPTIASAVIDLYDATHGRFTMTWSGADFASVAGPNEIIQLSWKLRDTHPDGTVIDLARGQILLYPENS